MAGQRRARRLRTAAVVVAVVVVVALGAWLYARGGGPVPSWLPGVSAGFDPLGASGPEEAALRSVRLAGFERAVVGADGGTAVLRLEIPAVSSAGDVEIAWQAAVASLAEAYPDERRYVVQLFEADTALIEVGWVGDEARQAVEADDPEALRAHGTFAYLTRDGADE